jgi:hypothetical protein
VLCFVLKQTYHFHSLQDSAVCNSQEQGYGTSTTVQYPLQQINGSFFSCCLFSFHFAVPGKSSAKVPVMGPNMYEQRHALNVNHSEVSLAEVPPPVPHGIFWITQCSRGSWRHTPRSSPGLGVVHLLHVEIL